MVNAFMDERHSASSWPSQARTRLILIGLKAQEGTAN